jgi:hypothetical protein
VSNYAAQLLAAAADAQGILAQIQGMDASAAGNVLLNGATLVGVFGDPAASEAMNAGGGYRKRVETKLTITRAQLTAAPASQTQLVRTDLAAPITYRIAEVSQDDPLHYVLTLVRVGP